MPCNMHNIVQAVSQLNLRQSGVVIYLPSGEFIQTELVQGFAPLLLLPPTQHTPPKSDIKTAPCDVVSIIFFDSHCCQMMGSVI